MSKAYSVVTDRILALLDAGELPPWRRTWSAAEAPQSIRGHKYRGINLLMTACAPYSDPRWLTFRQCREMGARVRKGEKATPIVLWKWLHRETINDAGERERVKVPLLRYYNVFNVDQTTLELDPVAESERRDHDPHEWSERIIAGYLERGGPSLAHDGRGRNFYRPADDSVHLTEAELFATGSDYYSTAFHELAHSTGHEKRLGRYFGLFGSDPYAREELVAEMAAAFLRAEAGLDAPTHLENSAAYIAGWSKKIRSDERLVVIAAAQAQKAADLILGREFGDDGADESGDSSLREKRKTSKAPTRRKLPSLDESRERQGRKRQTPKAETPNPAAKARVQPKPVQSEPESIDPRGLASIELGGMRQREALTFCRDLLRTERLSVLELRVESGWLVAAMDGLSGSYRLRPERLGLSVNGVDEGRVFRLERSALDEALRELRELKGLRRAALDRRAEEAGVSTVGSKEVVARRILAAGVAI